MGARAIWKGTVRLGAVRVPVKLYSALSDRSVHFRMLHRKDRSPVKQAMVNPETGDTVPYAEIQRAIQVSRDERVIFTQDELQQLQPEKSRDIDLWRFVPAQGIDHRWFARPYYLGPDDDEDTYYSLTQTLQETHQLGLARWVMRNKAYQGALTLFQGYPMLLSMHNAEQVVPRAQLKAPQGDALEKRELAMAQQLINMLDSPFDPGEFRDDYRERVLQLIEEKREGRSPAPPPRKPAPASTDLSQALQASLQRARA